jgi:hypothetical protein
LAKWFQRKKIKISANQKQELPMATMFLSNTNETRKSYRGPSIDASCKMLLYLAKVFQRKRFLQIDQSET